MRIRIHSPDLYVPSQPFPSFLQRTGDDVTKRQLQDLMARIHRGPAYDPLVHRASPRAAPAAGGSLNESQNLRWNSTAETSKTRSRPSAAAHLGSTSDATCSSAATAMYRAKKRSLVTVSRLKAQALKAETAYWIQKRLDEVAEREAKGLPVSKLPQGLTVDKDLLGGSLKELIPSESEEEDEEQEEDDSKEEEEDGDENEGGGDDDDEDVKNSELF